MSAREAALRVAVLGALLDEVKKTYSAARKNAEREFADIRKNGFPQQKVMLPDGAEIGLISIKGGTPSVDVDEDALTAWVAEHHPADVETYVAPEAWGSEDLVAFVAEHFPNLVRTRIRETRREALVKQMAENAGAVIDKDSGEFAIAGKVSQGDPTGAFTYRPAKDASSRIVAEWQAGRLGEIDLGPLALPPAETTRDAA